jgi:DNA-binding PadR family transcriptional regulator
MWFRGWKHFRRGGLRTWIISILQQSPKNGAELMDQIEMASQGWWRPSPGSVYPLLEELEKEGSIKKLNDGRYELTEKGKGELDFPFGMPPERPRSLEGVLSEMNGYVSYLEDVSKSNKSKIAPHLQAVKRLRDRLQAITEQ